MKLNFFNILVIVLFILVIVSATMLSCSNYQPHHADNVFQKHSKFEGFKRQKLVQVMEALHALARALDYLIQWAVYVLMLTK